MAYREAGDVGSKPIKVLFVDDSATMRKVAEITFATESFELSLRGTYTIDGGKFRRIVIEAL